MVSDLGESLTCMRVVARGASSMSQARWCSRSARGHTTVFDETGLPELPLKKLDNVASEALLDEHAPDLHPHLRARILAEAAGNPAGIGRTSQGRARQ